MPEEITKLMKYGVRGLKNYESIMKNLNIIMKKVNRKTENQTYIKPATNLVLGTSKDQQGNNKK